MSTVAMPQLGESVSEGTVVRWLKQTGDTVAVDEPLFEVATDKVNTEIPSLDAGILNEILVPEGATVPVGTILARIGTAGEADAARPAPPVAQPATVAPARPATAERAHLRSPVVRRLAREHALDLDRLTGSGPGGRITRADVLAHVSAGATGRQRGHRVAMTPMRARIAENVAAAKRQVADVFSVIEADMENVHAARVAAKLTYLPYIARATVEALQAFPAVNARIDGSELEYHDAVHLGIAVDLDERGLLVPVIRDAGDLNVTGLARAVAGLSEAARAGSIAPADLSGSTFTITNNGAFGTLMTAPVVHFPNVATLSTDAVEERVVPHNGGIAIRRRMYLCMSWDHRAFDGSTAAKFLARIKAELEGRDWRLQP